MRRWHRTRGFTLAELAVVTVVVALLLGSLLMPMGAQREQRAIAETQSALDDIREALIGFVLINGRLPCPDTSADPTLPGYGSEAAACTGDLAADGYLPWKTLGVREFDAWGNAWTQATTPRRGHWRYRIERRYADAAQARTLMLLPASSATPCPSGSPFPDDCLSIRNALGQALTDTTERPLAIVYSTGADGIANGHNASFEANRNAAPTYQSGERDVGFDDLPIWISRPLLASRMVAAGKLP